MNLLRLELTKVLRQKRTNIGWASVAAVPAVDLGAEIDDDGVSF